MEYEKLIRKCIRNERKAQHQLFETYSDRMFVVAFRYLRNRYAAEEVIANAFLKIFRSLGNFNPEGEHKFQAWMRKIVVNESLMELRRMKQIPVFTCEIPELISGSDSGEKIYYDELVLLIENLPEGYRLVFKLYVIEGYTHSEIAALIGISEGTSKSQLHKARLQLQHMLVKTEMNDERK
ncbi:MAG: sigma-70 family RNA polymerase sigma factor [Prolixibacteraceae bacterium]